MSPAAAAVRLRDAASRQGKPAGNHMIAVFEALAAHGSGSENKEERDLADIMASAAAAIRAETRMVEDLQAAAAEVVALIERRDGLAA